MFLSLYFLFTWSKVLCLEGKNVCIKQETFLVTARKSYNEPYQIRTYEWCYQLPPRCPKYRIAYKVGYRIETKPSTKQVTVCCSGHVKNGDEPNCIPCLHGRYGANCEKECLCKNDGLCDRMTGSCACKTGWQGTDCGKPCSPGSYGYKCEQKCRCENDAKCDPISGVCQCAPGYIGLLCSERIPKLTPGEQCANCVCQNGGTFNHVTGKCFCSSGWKGDVCANPCQKGYYGEGCSIKCSCYNNASCHHITGICECGPGYRGEQCQEECSLGTYGLNCSKICQCKHGGKCSHIDGLCFCPPGFVGVRCELRVCGGLRSGEDVALNITKLKLMFDSDAFWRALGCETSDWTG